MPHAIRRVDIAGRYVAWTHELEPSGSMLMSWSSVNRDITDNLQLLLRKSGHYLHTSAEKEVVRTIKEKTCYIAPNLAKEDKEMLGRTEEFRLPDGKVIQVGESSRSQVQAGSLMIRRDVRSSEANDIGRPRSCSTPS